MTMWHHQAQQDYAGSYILERALREWSLGDASVPGSGL